ncbi:MAG: TfoX/Sxy family DNA transformation protein [Rubricoccaceae bacterium]|nr:TfoX/Sxy family DNA transformation protein [Rubricoccaceae bacterium]
MAAPKEPLTGLKNLGPQSAAMLREVGIETPEGLREAGAVMAYKLLQYRFGRVRVNALFLFALEGALTDRHWNSFTAAERACLRAEADGELEIRPG